MTGAGLGRPCLHGSRGAPPLGWALAPRAPHHTAQTCQRQNIIIQKIIYVLVLFTVSILNQVLEHKYFFVAPMTQITEFKLISNKEILNMFTKNMIVNAPVHLQITASPVPGSANGSFPSSTRGPFSDSARRSITCGTSRPVSWGALGSRLGVEGLSGEVTEHLVKVVLTLT